MALSILEYLNICKALSLGPYSSDVSTELHFWGVIRVLIVVCPGDFAECFIWAIVKWTILKELMLSLSCPCSLSKSRSMLSPSKFLFVPYMLVVFSLDL